jgi:hypothetical protein
MIAPGVAGVLVGLLVRVGLGKGVSVGCRGVRVGGGVMRTGVGVSVRIAGSVTAGDSWGVIVGISPGVGVLVGARVGRGA